MLPGDEGGDAIASVLSGAVNPSGKLAFTYPRYASSHTTYDHKYTDRIDTDFSQNAFDPLYPFGHGLSYTSFSYSGLKMNRETYGMTDTLHFNVSLTNSGSRSGTEVVQVYISDSVASVTPSVARLRAYARVSLEAGETKELSFMLPLSELRFIGRDLKPTLEAGDFGLRIADRQTTFRVQ
jgi:beta-glucosidase